MGLPTFNGFSLSDDNFITERIVFKGFADRSVVRANVNRREGIKVLATEFGEKEITVEGRVVASSAGQLQTLLDDMKEALTGVEGDLIIESGRTWLGTVLNLVIPDEHYNQSTTRFEATFICTNPFAVGGNLSAITPVQSGIFTYSGTVVISGTTFARPTVVYTPAGAALGNTNIKTMNIYHVQTGQTVTISGFGTSQGLSYANSVNVNYDDFRTLEGANEIDNSGGFSRWQPGTNNFTVTVSGRFPGGSVTVSYQPRYL